MDGRSPPAIAYGVTGCGPAEEAEFSRWYQEVHFRDALSAGVYSNPVLFHHAATTVPPDEGRFLATYEISSRSLEKAVEAFSSSVPQLQRDYDEMKGRRVFGGWYMVRHRSFSIDSPKPTNSLLAIRLACSDEAQSAEMQSWFRDLCLPQAVKSSSFHTSSLLERSAHQPAPRWEPPTRFLALFESALGRPSDLKPLYMDVVFDLMRPECARVLSTSTFHRVSPLRSSSSPAC